MDLDRLAEIMAASFRRIEERFDALEQRMDRRHAEMLERFQSVNDRFGTIDRRFDQVTARPEHVSFRQDMLEKQFDPLASLVRDLEKSMRTGYAGVLKQLEHVQLQVVVVNERLDTISDEMRQRFRSVNERLG